MGQINPQDLQQVLHHYRSPLCYGKPAQVDYQYEHRNPACGDALTVYYSFDPLTERHRWHFDGESCSVSVACASVLFAHINNVGIRAVTGLDLATFTNILPFEIPENRIDCVRLPLQAVQMVTAVYDLA